MSTKMVAAALCVSSLCACSDLADTHRWASAHNVAGTGDEAMVQVYAAPGPAPGASPSTPFAALSDRGQAAYIAERAKYAKTSVQLTEALNSPLSKVSSASSGQPVTDKVQRILVETLTRPISDYRPGDRIMRAVVNVRPLNFTFGNYTVAQTSQKTLDITALTRSTSQTGSATLSAAPPGSPVTGSAMAGFTHTVGTTTTLHDSEEVLTVTPKPACLTVTREGGYGIDLTGDTLISLSTFAADPGHHESCGVLPPDVEMAYEDSDRDPVLLADSDLTFGAKGPSVDASKLPGQVHVYPAHPFAAQVTIDYVLRRIDSGNDSYEEGTQTVSLISGHKTRCEIVLQSDELTPPLFVLINDRRAVVDAVIDGNETVFAFTDPEAARSAAKWLTNSHSTHIGKAAMTNINTRSFDYEPKPSRPATMCDGKPRTS